MRTGDEAGARTAREQRDAGMDAQNLQRRLRVRKELRRHENEAERNRPLAELRPQAFRPCAQVSFIEIALPVSGGGKFIIHRVTVAFARAIANWERYISFGWRPLKVSSATPDLSSSPRPSATRRSNCF